MGIVMLFLLLCILYKASLSDDQEHFFDLHNTKAMRGFWCIVIMMVHVPMAYTNKIQDVIGSFAYIGVTFFFMTSSYGLKLSIDKQPGKIKHFWRDRLPKLLIISWVVNIFVTIAFIVSGLYTLSLMTIVNILYINKWVVWLIICYFFFWITKLIMGNKNTGNFVVCGLVAVFSMTMYYLVTTGKHGTLTWHTECYGFIWGILLACVDNWFYNYHKEKWLVKLGISCVIALILGGAYLQFKHVVIAGDYILKIALGFAILLFILIANVKLSFGNSINQFIGEISFEVYLIHGQVYKLLNYGSSGELSSGVFIVISIIITLVCAYITHFIASYLIKQIYKIDFFKRNKD